MGVAWVKCGQYWKNGQYEDMIGKKFSQIRNCG